MYGICSVLWRAGSSVVAIKSEMDGASLLDVWCGTLTTVHSRDK